MFPAILINAFVHSKVEYFLKSKNGQAFQRLENELGKKNLELCDSKHENDQLREDVILLQAENKKYLDLLEKMQVRNRNERNKKLSQSSGSNFEQIQPPLAHNNNCEIAQLRLQLEEKERAIKLLQANSQNYVDELKGQLFHVKENNTALKAVFGYPCDTLHVSEVPVSLVSEDEAYFHRKFRNKLATSFIAWNHVNQSRDSSLPTIYLATMEQEQ